MMSVMMHILHTDTGRTKAHLLGTIVQRIGDTLVMPNGTWKVHDVRFEYEITDFNHIVPDRRIYRLRSVCIEVKSMR